MRIALASLLISVSASAASLTGAVVDQTGAYVSHAAVELASEGNNYRVQADDAGFYRFSNLPAGEYALTFQAPGFRRLTIKSIVLLEREQKQLPDVPLEVVVIGCTDPPFRSFVLLPNDTSFGQLSGSVLPPAAEVEVTLVCRTFNTCRSTKTDANGRYSFDMLSPGIYGLNFRREGFYPNNTTGYDYKVNAGWESVYYSVTLEKCFNGNCDPKLRPPEPIRPCE